MGDAVRRATRQDAPTLGATWASAFGDDPFMNWVFPDTPSRPRRLRTFFDGVARVSLRNPDHEIYISDDGNGAALWRAPNRWKVGMGELVRSAPSMIRSLGRGAPRFLGALTTLEKAHPAEEHYYLEVLGTATAVQGRGVGGAVISDMLERCDREGLPAYLESSNRRNVPFYARHGFEERDEIRIKNGPSLTAMWRNPKG